MFPGGLGNINPRQMQRMMKSLGIESEEVEALKVTIELKDKKIEIENPQVTAINLRGQKTYTIMGEEKEVSKGFPEEDIEMVMKQANVSREKAINALKKNNADIAEAILDLKKEKD